MHDQRNQPQRQDVSPQLSLMGVWPITSPTPIMSIVADRGQDVVATASADDNVALWRMGGGIMSTLPNTRGAKLTLSPLGSLLAAAPLGRPVQVWSMPDGALLDTCALPTEHIGDGADEAITAFAWHPAYAAIFLGTNRGRIYRWRLGQSGDILEMKLSHLTMPDIAITALLVNSQGTWLAIGRGDGVLGLTTLETRLHQLLYPGRHQHGVGAFHTGRGFFLISQSLRAPVCRLWEPGGISPWVREWRLADTMNASSAGGRYPFVVDPLERWAFSAATLGAIQPWRHWRWPPEDRLPIIVPPGVSSADLSMPVTTLATDAHGDLLVAGDLAGRIWLWKVQAIPAA